jgi:hypothetical protein
MAEKGVGHAQVDATGVDYMYRGDAFQHPLV